MALMSLTWVYFGQMPLTSDPRTPVQVAQWMDCISSLAVILLQPIHTHDNFDDVCTLNKQEFFQVL